MELIYFYKKENVIFFSLRIVSWNQVLNLHFESTSPKSGIFLPGKTEICRRWGMGNTLFKSVICNAL